MRESLLTMLAFMAGKLVRWTMYLPGLALMSAVSRWPWAAGSIASFGAGWYFFEKGQYRSVAVCALIMTIMLVIHFGKTEVVAEAFGKGIGGIFNAYIGALTFTYGLTIGLFAVGGTLFIIGMGTAKYEVAGIGCVLVIGGILSPIAQGIHGKEEGKPKKTN